MSASAFSCIIYPNCLYLCDVRGALWVHICPTVRTQWNSFNIGLTLMKTDQLGLDVFHVLHLVPLSNMTAEMQNTLCISHDSLYASILRTYVLSAGGLTLEQHWVNASCLLGYSINDIKTTFGQCLMLAGMSS